MREIKFRAWNFEDKKMFNMRGYFENKPYNNPKLYHWMQYTGLTDKNGKPIYEGDIVDCTMMSKFGTLPHRGEIIYFEKLGSFATKNKGGKTLLHNLQLWTIEVIGNIHENSELLK